jgi:hypothetical protein
MAGVEERSLETLGFAGVPLRQPLTYPGRAVDAPSLLAGRRLFALRPGSGPPGAWGVELPSTAPYAVPATLDSLLAELGAAPVAGRHAVLAIGSNASPGQVSHKLDRVGVHGAVPMVPVRVLGVGVGLSGHISAAGYVAASPYLAPDTPAAVVVCWLDDAQLAATDATEFPHYARARLPGSVFPVTLPQGRVLDCAHLYVNARGVLAGLDGRPRARAAQEAVLRGLMAESAALRALFGPGPEDWIRAAAADAALRARGTALFAEEGRLYEERGFAPYVVAGPRP